MLFVCIYDFGFYNSGFFNSGFIDNFLAGLFFMYIHRYILVLITHIPRLFILARVTCILYRFLNNVSRTF